MAKRNPTPAQLDELERVYDRYVRYWETGKSPYGGEAPITFREWMKLPANARPGGPE